MPCICVEMYPFYKLPIKCPVMLYTKQCGLQLPSYKSRDRCKHQLVFQLCFNAKTLSVSIEAVQSLINSILLQWFCHSFFFYLSFTSALVCYLQTGSTYLYSYNFHPIKVEIFYGIVYCVIVFNINCSVNLMSLCCTFRWFSWFLYFPVCVLKCTHSTNCQNWQNISLHQL